VALDLAGHGESGMGRQAWTIEAFGGDVAAVVEELGLDRVVLVGHSMGGNVILEAARRLPGRVDGLVWIDAHRQLGSALTPEEIAATIAPFRAEFAETTRSFVRGMFPPGADESLVERVAADMSSAPPAVALSAGASELAYGGRVAATLRELNLPIVSISAEYPPPDVESLERHGVEVVVMPGVGHFPMLENPRRFNAVLRSVVTGLP